MEKVVIYGLGERFQDNREWLECNYDVVGYCDKDITKIERYANGLSVEALVSADIQYDKIIITPARALNIAEELHKAGEVPFSKMELFDPPVASRYRNIPEQLFFATNNEDAILLLLIQKLNIDVKNIYYAEWGGEHVCAGSFTYWFYLNGGRGIIGGDKRSLQSAVNVFRSDDTLLDNNDDEAFRGLLERSSEDINLIILHDRWAIAQFYNMIDKEQINGIIYLADNTENCKNIMQRHKYTWYTSTVNGMIFYKWGDEV